MRTSSRGTRIPRRLDCVTAAIPLLRTMGLVLLLTILPAPGRSAAAADLVDRPVAWYEAERRDIARPAERDPNLLWDGISNTFVHPVGRFLNPGRLARKAGRLFGGDPVSPAANVNALDEVPNSSWFTNRIGLYPIGRKDLLQFGEAEPGGPDTTGPWTIVSAKTQGVTPGFNIRDARGRTYLIKFDPPGYEGTSTAAGAITGRFLHAAGYNVPVDNVVTFRRENLTLGDKVSIRLADGSRRPMTTADIDSMLARVKPHPDGSRRAIASRFLAGKPIGPFTYLGRRKDDPNDRIDHQDRRELRGLRLFAAWLAHFDTKQNNSLDTFIDENGQRYVRHHLIDFASSLGAGAGGAVPRFNFEYTFDAPAVLGRTVALGLHEDDWRYVERPPGLPEVGFFESDRFDPLEWKPLAPNTAFANLTDRDGYWAAKIISAFTDEQIREIVAFGRYADPAAAAYIARTLSERRDEIARVMFDRVPPLDFFRLEESRLVFDDLGAERGIYEGKPRYRVRLARAGADRSAATSSGWMESEATAVDLSLLPTAADPGRPFIRLDCQVDRGAGWSSTVTAWIAPASRRVLAVER